MASHLFYVRKTDVWGLNSLLDIAQLDNLSNWRGDGTARNRVILHIIIRMVLYMLA